MSTLTTVPLPIGSKAAVAAARPSFQPRVFETGEGLLVYELFNELVHGSLPWGEEGVENVHVDRRTAEPNCSHGCTEAI
jgi:hypothetical protein